MPYSNNPLDPTGRSILTQVSLKAAIELASSGKIEVGEVVDYTKAFTEELVTFIGVQVAEYQAALPAAPQGDSGFNGEQALRDEFGATPADSGGVRILGQQHGPIPPWAIAQFAAAGVTKVFDNREGRKGNQPWFKTPKDAEKYGEPNDKPFWPPRD